ncbi:hypothetical protein AMJ85_06585 [candidate division BRC1 bacterium SM23_51]|nr:MAG: hypothetical protein AMJ85_06585 [candidate division BRC1 bacterium SM23_51]
MRRRATVLVALAAWIVVPLACRPPKEQLSEDVKKEIAALQSEKSLIEEKVRDIERSRSLLAERTREELENMRRSIESIQNALGKIEERLDAMGMAAPTTAASPKRLPIEISIVLVVIIVCFVLIALKLRSIRVREASRHRAEEAAGDSGNESSQS